MSKKIERIYTLDIETDPFLYGRLPKAFQIGFYDGENFVQYWGDGCIDRMYAYLQNIPPGIIYAHNGGRFDVLGYLMDWIIGRPMRVINNRIAKCQMPCNNFRSKETFHEIRDSYCLYPFKLQDYKGHTQKKEIAIGKLENNECWRIEDRYKSTSRQVYREEITEYLKYDCMTLHELVVYFRENIGHELTIGAAAIKALKGFHDFKNLDPSDDVDIRGDYFYGGRVDCLQAGILNGKYKLYDVNSMYPYVMANFEHPIGDTIRMDLGSDGIQEDTFFITARGWNKRAFPVRRENGNLDYTQEYGIFHVTIHEWEMAEKYGLFDCEEILHTWNCEEHGNFNEFVMEYHNERKRAQWKKDEIRATCLKYLLNSSYGKFAQNPEHYKEYEITRWGENPSSWGDWEEEETYNMDGDERGKFKIWTRPSRYQTRYNVATGASITGAARAILMEAIHLAKNPVYCDTDSLLCENLPLEKDETKLGAWKLEAEIDTAAIAGKKLYAFFEKGQVVKKAHKGFKLTGAQIMAVAKGDMTVVSKNDAPTFKLSGKHGFITRQVRRTA